MDRRLVFALGVVTTCVAPAAGQPQTTTARVDPVRCWWRTSAAAVRVGEPFSVVLTCASLETDAVKVVVDQSKLEPSVVQFAPFEVTGGSHAADLHADDRRFFQYEYRLRLIAENLFGRDVQLPETRITYRVQSRTGQGTAIEGRDQTYLLPAQALRVLSLVASDAADIRDASSETFADLDQRAFRSNLLIVIGGVLFALAGLMAALAAVRLVARYRKPLTTGDRLMADAAILRAVGRELAAVQREREQRGWSAELAGRALTALRLIGSYALGRRVARTAQPAQSPVDGLRSVADGTLVLRTGWRRGKRVVVSGSATARSVAHERARVSVNGNARRTQQLEALEQALGRFTAAHYGRNGSYNDEALDESLASGMQLLRRLKLEQSWPMKRFARQRAPGGTETRAWSR
jgi:hypothetical protein